MLVFAPCLFTLASRAERAAWRRAVQNVQFKQLRRQLFGQQFVDRAQKIVLGLEVQLVMPRHLGVNVVRCNHFTASALVTHAGAATTGERAHNLDAVGLNAF